MGQPGTRTPDWSGQEKNPYLYAEGNPVNRIDPEGLLDRGRWRRSGRTVPAKAARVPDTVASAAPEWE
jgi:hypothetical protein